MLQYSSVNKALAPLPPSNRTGQRLQHQVIYGIEPLDWLGRLAYTKSARNLCHTKGYARVHKRTNHEGLIFMG